ncbi:arabinan endo-1,5-alpha-L-arabinosidase [Prolixibacteraceae bacterium Z1-6]|uniref:Arabinan endo-1,5-alpha-L-arabinosidase n=1 Tax=Draconibacterium aestuarii TaxID=2998507 RepID=A0A9X3F5R4_9BACT|nr:arabinan endo-1,5-alpha-L-arabinosidase [Prolixibacteraceae bacterium Z1-6]
MKKYPLYIIGIAFLGFSCSKDSDIDDPIDPEDPVEEVSPPRNEDFIGPTYSDNYISIMSWSNRSKWNLANVHDPSVEKCDDYYYMYQTDASYGNVHEGHGHYPYRRSKDLINWEFQGMVFETVPAWVKDSLNNKRARMTPALPAIENPTYGFWAPCIRKVGNKYRLYYSVVVTNPIVGNSTETSWTERAFIGLAETDDLASNNWEDKGMVVCSEPDGEETYTRTSGNDWSGYFQFNAIDPSFIVTAEGEHWLIYGSWHSGIAALQLNTDTGKPDNLETLEDYGVRIAGRGDVNNNRWQALEAPEIIYNPETDYYYLFLAYDELSVAYNTRVARSKNITGPYLGINGENVTNGNECWPMLAHPYAFANHTGWVGISHCCVFQNPETNQWYYSSQGRLPENVPGINASNAIMMGHVREINWTEDGWPVVMPERFAGVPQLSLSIEAMYGQYEIITMDYQYRTIQTSKTFKLHSDGTVSGILSGTWSLNASNGILTLGNLQLIVRDGCNWESSGREATLVLSGLTTQGKPVWIKKIN